MKLSEKELKEHRVEKFDWKYCLNKSERLKNKI